MRARGSIPSRLRRPSSPVSQEPCSTANCLSPAAPSPTTDLPHTTIYLPTRRAARGLREAFFRRREGEALLLPRIRALGDPDEDEALIFGAEDCPEEAASAKPHRGAAEAAGADGARAHFQAPASPRGSGRRGVTAFPVVDVTPDRHLSCRRPRQSDRHDRNPEIDLSRLDAIVPDEFAGHWQLTVEFLKIVTEHWPKYLAENRLVSPVARRTC